MKMKCVPGKTLDYTETFTSYFTPTFIVFTEIRFVVVNVVTELCTRKGQNDVRKE